MKLSKAEKMISVGTLSLPDVQYPEIPHVDFRDADLVMEHGQEVGKIFDRIGITSAVVLLTETLLMQIPGIQDTNSPFVVLPFVFTYLPALGGAMITGIRKLADIVNPQYPVQMATEKDLEKLRANARDGGIAEIHPSLTSTHALVTIAGAVIEPIMRESESAAKMITAATEMGIDLPPSRQDRRGQKYAIPTDLSTIAITEALLHIREQQGGLSELGQVGLDELRKWLRSKRALLLAEKYGVERAREYVRLQDEAAQRFLEQP